MRNVMSMASMKVRVTFFGLMVLAVVLAGCAAPSSGGQATQVPVAPAATTAPVATAAPAPTTAPAAATAPAATAAPAQAAQAATVMVTKSDTLGQILADDEGKSLYLFTKDTKDTSNCYDKCAQAWPPLLTAGAPKASDGADAALLGTTTRTDGTTQVTYNGWPLYYYVKDAKAGDVTGQDVGGVWYVLSPKGDMLKAATVMATKSDTLGQILADDAGMSLYLFTKDTKDTSNCYDKCAQAWPPLLTVGAPKAGDGADAALLGTTTRTDGMTQVTYNGWPLYYYVKDLKAGDVTGQDVGGVWYVLSPRGDKLEAATVMVTKSDTLGQILADDEGKSLYLFTKDTKDTSNCYDKCAQAWPPLLTAGAPKAGDGADATLLGTTTRTDGTTQVTYNGWPLYYYVKDAKAGDVTGQDVGGVWYVLSPKGDKVGAPAAAASPAPAPAAQAKTVKVVIKDFSFGAPLTIAIGTTVEWTNEDSMAHTVTASNGAFDSGNMDKGATYSFTFTQEGTFSYVCTYHANMKGQIVVTK